MSLSTPSSRTTAALIGALVLSCSAAACSSGSTPSGSGATGTAAGAGTTLTVWIMDGTNPDSSAYFTDLKGKFKAQTGADLDIQLVPWTGAHDKFTTAIAGGTTPDVAEIGATWTPEFGANGALLDVTDKAKQAGLDSGFIPSLTEAGSIDGSLYGVPWYAGIRSFVYNKDIFAKADIANPPTSWAELTADVDKIKASQPDVIPLPVPGAAEFMVYPWIYGAGGDIATKQGKTYTATIDSPQSQAGLTYITNLVSQHHSSTPAAATWSEKDLLAAYGKGNVAMTMTGSWTPATIKQQAPEVYAKTGAFPIPGKDGGLAGSVVGGSHLGIFAGSKHPDLAWQLVQLMTTGDEAARWAKSSNFFPADNAGIQALMSSSDPMVTPFVTQLKDASRTVPVTPAFAQIQAKKTVLTMMQSILTGKADVASASATAAKEMNASFAAG